jgi:hypothetical protein
MKDNAIATVVMTKEEAETCVSEIRSMSHKLRELLVTLYEREGWKALGYESFADCAKQEFGNSAAYMYRQLASGTLEKRLPIGDIGDNKESHLRPLITILKDDDMREEAWHLAHALTHEPTAKTFEGAAYTVLVSSMEDDLPMLVHRMRHGEVSSHAAYSIALIARDKPDDFKHVCSAISDPSLAPMLRRVYYDNSDTWAEILATGCIPSATGDQVPLGLANAQSLKAYLYVASDEHRVASIEKNRGKWNIVQGAADNVIAEARKARACSEPLSKAIEKYDEASKEVNND